jgi:SAM-dependent methyltransferase
MPGAEQFYRGEAGRAYHEGKRGIPAAAYPWVARARAARLAGHVAAGDVVFEFGVGQGWNLAQLNCRRRLGFDLAEDLEAAAQAHGIEFVRALETLPDGFANVVLCHHTLEHVWSPADTLRGLARLLTIDGRLVLVTPWERERRHARYNRAEPNHHLFTWSPQNLGNLMTACGFEVIEVARAVYGYDRFAAVWACRLRMGELGFRLLRAGLQCARPFHEVRLLGRLPQKSRGDPTDR